MPRNVPPPPANSPRFTSGRPNSGLGRGDDHVAAEQQLEAAGHGGGVGRADDRRSRPRRRASLAEAGDASASSALDDLVAAGERAQVHAGAEGPVAGAGEHDGPDVGVGLGRDDGAAPSAPSSARRERVAGLGPVEAQHQDGAAPLDARARRLGVRRASLTSRSPSSRPARRRSRMRSSTTGPNAWSFSSSPARWKPCSSTTAELPLGEDHVVVDVVDLAARHLGVAGRAPRPATACRSCRRSRRRRLARSRRVLGPARARPSRGRASGRRRCPSPSRRWRPAGPARRGGTSRWRTGSRRA